MKMKIRKKHKMRMKKLFMVKVTLDKKKIYKKIQLGGWGKKKGFCFFIQLDELSNISSLCLFSVIKQLRRIEEKII